MKWLRFIFMISAASWFLFALNEFRKEIDNYNLGNASDYQYEKSPPELKKIINTHLIFHEKIKTTFHDLIKDVKPLLNNEDAEKIEEIAQVLLEQYRDRLNLAAQALDTDDIEKVINILSDTADTLDNLYVVQESLLSLKRQLTPVPSAPKNKGLITSA